MAGREGNAERRPDASQRSVHRLPLLAFLCELSPAPGRDPVVLATPAALRNLPPRLDVAKPLEPMQNGVEHPVRPLHAPSGQLPNSLEDGVAVAVPFGQDRQDDRGRGSGYQVLVDLHGFAHRAALTNSNPCVHSGIIYGSARYVKDRAFKEYGRGTFPRSTGREWLRSARLTARPAPPRPPAPGPPWRRSEAQG